jgi:hypothetical protein
VKPQHGLAVSMSKRRRVIFQGREKRIIIQIGTKKPESDG